jgi:hypothetical protein
MHRATVFESLFLRETYSGGDLRIDCQRYAEHQHPEQKKLHVRAFHKSYFSFFERVELKRPFERYRRTGAFFLDRSAQSQAASAIEASH